MSLPINAAPPGHLPKAATPPWPIEPPPHGAAIGAIPVRPRDRAGLSALGKSLIGGAIAALGLAVALPLLLRRQAEPASPPRRRRGRKAARSKT